MLNSILKLLAPLAGSVTDLLSDATGPQSVPTKPSPSGSRQRTPGSFEEAMLTPVDESQDEEFFEDSKTPQLEVHRSIHIPPVEPLLSPQFHADALATQTARVPTCQIASSHRSQEIVSDAGNTGLRPQREELLWFKGGDLVLIAREVEFRVYKGPLEAQSLVFRDMLSLPQPISQTGSSTGEKTDAPAVVHVSDSPEDLRHFLRLFVGEPPSLDPSFAEVAAYIRLGHKYQCDKLVQRTIAYLKKYYVADWDAWWKVTSYDPPAFRPIERIGVINLARLVGAQELLPVALMYCCMLGGEIVHGFTRGDGAQERLCADDLARCFVGKARLLEASVRAMHAVFRPVVAKGCKHPARCREALNKLLSEMCANETLMGEIRTLQWDTFKTAYIDSTDENRELCGKCYEMLGRTGRQGEQQREMFRKLPETMGITVEGWAALLKGTGE